MLNDASAFKTYAHMTDLRRLIEYSARSLRKSVRVNTLKTTLDAFKSWAEKKCWKLQPVPWCSEGFFVDRDDRSEALGKDLLHILGHMYMQEAASMLPVSLLQPSVGSTVLDMSAAPGSKTTQIAMALQNRGVIVANDVQEKRLWALSSNLQRCSVMNVFVSRRVGQWFGKNMTGRFDYVLCDAPCTAQGTVRKDSDALRYCSSDNIRRMAKLQFELLEAAIHSARIGGKIVYSTCTLTPEENEMIVHAILEKYPDQLEVVDPMSIGFDCLKQGIEDSHTMQKSLHCTRHFPSVRLWPHTYDTEGFFAVLFHKTAKTKERTVTDCLDPLTGNALPRSRQQATKQYIEKWYGSSMIHGHETIFEQRDRLWLTNEEVATFAFPTRAYLLGMPCGKRIREDTIRIGQELVTLRGKEATKQTVAITEEELHELLRGKNITPVSRALDNGDVILTLDDMPLCRGLLKDGTVMNRLPREIVQMYG